MKCKEHKYIVIGTVSNAWLAPPSIKMVCEKCLDEKIIY